MPEAPKTPVERNHSFLFSKFKNSQNSEDSLQHEMKKPNNSPESEVNKPKDSPEPEGKSADPQKALATLVTSIECKRSQLSKISGLDLTLEKSESQNLIPSLALEVRSPLSEASTFEFPSYHIGEQIKAHSENGQKLWNNNNEKLEDGSDNSSSEDHRNRSSTMSTVSECKSSTITWADDNFSSGILADSESESAVKDTNTIGRRKKLSSIFASFGKGSKTSPKNTSKSRPQIVIHHNRESSVDSTSLVSPYAISDVLPSFVENNSSNTSTNRRDSFCSVAASDTTEEPIYDYILEGITDPKERKLFHVAREILTSEKTFIDVLNLLTEEFPRFVIEREKEMQCNSFGNDVQKILCGLPEYKELNKSLLSDLEDRIKNWREEPKLSDIFIKTGPMLKIYSQYIKTFEDNSRFYAECLQKSPQFANIVFLFEDVRCRKMKLPGYLLKPVQRMPQYSLLLESYRQNLEPGSAEYEDTEKAIAIVKGVAEYADEAIKLQVTIFFFAFFEFYNQNWLNEMIFRNCRKIRKKFWNFKVDFRTEFCWPQTED